MSVTPEHPETQITTWQCGCRPESKHVGLSHKTCPYCNKSIPQSVCTQVYLQVLQELRAEILRIKSQRWDKVTRLTRRCTRLFRLLTFLAIAAWFAMILLVSTHNTPGISDKLPDLLQRASMLWQKLSGMAGSLWGNLVDTVESIHWSALRDKFLAFPLEALLDRIWLFATTAFKMIWLIPTRIIDLVKLVISFISSLLS